MNSKNKMNEEFVHQIFKHYSGELTSTLKWDYVLFKTVQTNIQ